MRTTFETYGKILFDPVDMTSKQKKQASWKKVAMIIIDKGEYASYYRWFLEKRFNLFLNPPMRGSHITIINDSLRDIGDGLEKWSEVKSQWDGQEVPIVLNTDLRSDGSNWWLNIPEEERSSIHYLRNQIGLDRPYFGLHMTVGHANEKNTEHSEYILDTIVNGSEGANLKGIQSLINKGTLKYKNGKFI